MSRRGKIIEKMECTTGDGATITVPIRMQRTINTPDSKTTFEAENKAFGIDESGKDLDEVRKAVYKAVGKARSIEWRPVFIVEIHTDNRDRHELERSVSLGVTGFLIGGDDEQGWQHMMVSVDSIKSGRWDNVRMRHQDATKGKLGCEKATIEGTTEEHYWGHGTAIEATEDNYNALARVQEAIQAIGERLGELVQPDKIVAFLANIKTQKLLPMM